MKSEHSRWICIWAFSSVCEVYFVLAELNEILVQLRHFCDTFRGISGILPYHSVFFLGGSNNVVDVAHTVVIWDCS